MQYRTENGNGYAYPDHNVPAEAWKPILDYENHYMGSSKGRIKSVKKFKGDFADRDKIIRTTIHKTGYEFIWLWKDGIKKRYSVHTIIANLFCDKIGGKNIVNHKNGVRSDNRAVNLEWVDKSGNMLHAMKELGVKRFGKDNPNSRYSDEEIDNLRSLFAQGYSKYRCQKITGIKRTTVSAILNNKLRSNKLQNEI